MHYLVVEDPEKTILPLGSDLQVSDGMGAVVDTARQTLPRNTLSTDVVVQPTASLNPGDYHLSDRRTIPCDHWQNSCDLLAAPSEFASFVVSDEIDSTAPAFEGLRSVAAERVVCLGNGCCGPFDVSLVTFSWTPGTDDTAGDEIAYNIYRRAPGTSDGLAYVAGPITGTKFYGYFSCNGSTRYQLPLLEPGAYVVRAVDWAGNEDNNVREFQIDNPCGDWDAGPRDTGTGCGGLGPRSGCEIGAHNEETSAAWMLIPGAVLAARLLRDRYETRHRPYCRRSTDRLPK